MKKILIILPITIFLSLIALLGYSYGHQNTDKGTITENTQEKSIVFKLKDNSDVNLIYMYTKTKNNELLNDVLVYNDSNNIEYWFDKSSKKLVRLNTHNYGQKDKKIDFTSAKILAKKYVSKYLDISNYEIDDKNSYSKELNNLIVWRKYLNNIPTSESACVFLNSDGSLASIGISYTDNISNRGENDQNNSISKEQAIELLEDKIKADNSNNPFFSSYKIIESDLFYDHTNKLVWSFMVELRRNLNGEEDCIGKSYYIDALSGDFINYKQP
jgi:hypothetical protein